MLTKAMIDNSKELYNNLQANIQDASKFLTNLHIEIGDANKILKDLGQQIFVARNQLGDLKGQIEAEQISIDKERKDIQTRRDELVQIEKDHVLAVTNSSAKVNRNNVLIKETSEALALAQREYDLHASKLTGRKEQLSSMTDELTLLMAKVNTTSDELKALQKSTQTMRAENAKEIDTHLAKKAEIEKEIYIKQRSLDGFQANKTKMEEDLKRREYDADVLLGRAKMALDRLGVPYKL